jgi:flagellar hook-length control protein FliK
VQTPALAAAPRAADAATTTAHVAAPIDSPAFAPTLATQVRWWAQDGVQQAQLTLNPAEMGPVAVRIVVLDGREARIDFSADFAATRSAIEAALPVLAAALDDSGLKLAGGGVHDGSAQRQSNWAQAQAQAVTDRTPAHGNPRAVEALSAAPGATRAAGRGIVDLVA